MPEEDFHLSDRAPSRAHERRRLACSASSESESPVSAIMRSGAVFEQERARRPRSQPQKTAV